MPPLQIGTLPTGCVCRPESLASIRNVAGESWSNDSIPCYCNPQTAELQPCSLQRFSGRSLTLARSLAVGLSLAEVWSPGAGRWWVATTYEVDLAAVRRAVPRREA